MEALDPVPGLDPNAFLTVVRNGGSEQRGKELDYRDVKIVQLAKRSRALSAKLEDANVRCVDFTVHRASSTDSMPWAVATCNNLK